MSIMPIIQANTNAIKKTDLLGLTLPEMQQWLVERGEAPFRAKQIYNWLYQHLVIDFRAMTNLPQALRDRLEQEASIGPMVARSELHSKDDRTRKVLLELSDGRLIESVLMLYPPIGESSARATVCVSTQAGCAFGCTFCATGQMGFDRHLSAGEIVAQVLLFARELRAAPWSARGLPGSTPIDHITNIVLMGMGEPLHNYNNVLKELLAACQDYIAATGRQVTFEYVLLAGVNDTPEHAHQLGELLAPLKQFAHVNCIPVNATSADYRPPGGEAIRAFRDILFEHGVSNSVRAERGDDIAAACGQLRTRFERNRKQE